MFKVNRTLTFDEFVEYYNKQEIYVTLNAKEILQTNNSEFNELRKFVRVFTILNFLYKIVFICFSCIFASLYQEEKPYTLKDIENSIGKGKEPNILFFTRVIYKVAVFLSLIVILIYAFKNSEPYVVTLMAYFLLMSIYLLIGGGVLAGVLEWSLKKVSYKAKTLLVDTILADIDIYKFSITNNLINMYSSVL